MLEDSLSGNPKDTLFIGGLTMLGYNSKTTTKEDNHDLEELFSYKGIPDKVAELHKCIPKYRDILIFRHKSEISGIAKICFDCDLASFSGAKSLLHILEGSQNIISSKKYSTRIKLIVSSDGNNRLITAQLNLHP